MERTLPPAPLQASGPSEYGQGMELRVLGPVEVVEDGRSFPLGGPKQRTVLALLISNAGRSVSTGSLINGVYGEEPPQGARRSIQTYVSNLRGELGDIIVGTNDGYELAAERPAVDAMRFEDAVSAAKDREPAEASQLLREALSLWHGHPYADVDGGHDLDSEIRRLDEMRMQALEARIDADLAAGYHRELIAEIESLTVEYPLRERFCEQQMVALYRSGRQAEALRAYERTRTYLVNEMGLDPSPNLRDLERRILDQDTTLDLEAASSIRRATVMVTDIADPASLSRTSTNERTALIDQQSTAIDAAAERYDGEVFANSGTAVYLLFPDGAAAAAAACDIQRQLDGTEPQGHQLRIAIDVGDIETGDTVAGPPVNRSAAIVAAGHGGQVLLSSAAQQEITETADGGWVVKGLGSQDLRGLDAPEVVHQLVIDGLPGRFPDLRTQAVPAPLPMAARGLAGYELRDEVGSGAFGIVHRAYQPSVGREVAIKVIKPEWANQPEFVRRFEIEAQLVARLEHPHIVPLYDYWREPDSAYLVMRWLRGGTLAGRVTQGTLTIGEAHALLADIGPALAFAHRQGVVHRDIKPSNVLLDDEGGAYLTDFGIAGDLVDRANGSITDDVRSLAALLKLAIGEADEPAVSELLARATSDAGFADVQSFIAEWEHAVGTGDATSQAVGYTPTRNPYKGLSAFGELDAADFHGRDDLVDQLTDALSQNDLVVAVGPSGIGKSSVVSAGLIPALREGAIEDSDRWLITTMVPGAFPFDELAAALLQVAVKAPSDLEEVLSKDARGLSRAVTRCLPPDETLVLVIDQFEELFTLCDDEDLRAGFLDTLVASVQNPHSRVRFVVTIRADFFDRPLAYGAFGTLMQQSTVPVTSPTRDELLDMIRRPAADVGVSFEHGLPERIADQVRDQPGGLPLLEFALSELFDDRDSDVVAFTAYENSGGVLAALGRRAESTFQGLDGLHQDAAEDIFLRMVAVNEAGRDTRRRVRLSELKRLDYDPRSVDTVLSTFATHRLVTFDRDPITRGPTVEVAHEAILTEWRRLADLLDRHRGELLLERRLQAALGEWENSDGADSYLLTGGRLTQYEQLATSGAVALTTRETDFLSASRTRDDQLQAARRKRRSLITAAFGVAAVVGLVLATVAFFAQQSAATERETARGQALAAAAVGVLEEDPELSLLLSIQSADTAQLDFEGRQALRASLAEHKTVASWTWEYSRLWMAWTDMSPDGTLVVVNGSHEDFGVWDVSGAEPSELWHERLPENYGSIAHFTTDGTQVAVIGFWQGFNDPTLGPPPEENLAKGVRFYDAHTGELLRILDGTDSRCESDIGPDQRFNDLLWIDPEGAWIESGECADMDGTYWWTIDPDTGARTSEPEPIPGDVEYVFVTSNGWLTEWTQATTIKQRNILTGEARPVIEARSDWPPLSPMGKFIIGAETIIDAATGEHLWRYYPNEFRQDGWLPPCFVTRFNQPETIAIIGCNDGTARVHDARSGRLIATLRGHTGWASAGSNTEGDLISTGGADGSVRVWDMSTPRGLRGISLQDGYYADSSLHVVGDRATMLVYPQEKSTLFDGGVSVMTRVSPGIAIVFDIDDGQEIAKITDAGGKVARLSPDGSRLAVQSVTESGLGLGSIRIHDLESRPESTLMLGNCEWEPFGLFWGGDSEQCSFGGDTFAADVTDLHWSPDGNWLAATAGRAQRVIVWNTHTGEIVFLTDRLPTYPLSSIQFSPDGAMLSASGKAGTWTFDTSDWSEIAMVTHPGRPSWAMRYTPDGSQLITAQAHRGQLRIFDTETWEQRDIETGRGQTRDMAISIDGRLVAIANNVGVIHVVDIETESVIETYPLPGTDISNVEFIDNDRHLLVTTAFGPVEILTLDIEELISEARTRLSRPFTETECATYSIDPCPTLEALRNG